MFSTIPLVQIERYNANIVILDWKLGARITTVYTTAAANAPMIGLMAAYFCMNFVTEFGIPIENVQFVGFSLGAHIGGSMAEEIHRRTRGRTIGQLTGENLLPCRKVRHPNALGSLKFRLNLIEFLKHSMPHRRCSKEMDSIRIKMWSSFWRPYIPHREMTF